MKRKNLMDEIEKDSYENKEDLDEFDELDLWWVITGWVICRLWKLTK